MTHGVGHECCFMLNGLSGFVIEIGGVEKARRKRIAYSAVSCAHQLLTWCERNDSRSIYAARCMVSNAGTTSCQLLVLSPQSGLIQSRSGGIRCIARRMRVIISSRDGMFGVWIS